MMSSFLRSGVAQVGAAAHAYSFSGTGTFVSKFAGLIIGPSQVDISENTMRGTVFVAGLSTANSNVGSANVYNVAVTYTINVSPTVQGEIPVRIDANTLTDAAGNGNTASNTLLFK
jgi:hypothetical protein